jgi:hypothetical protein
LNGRSKAEALRVPSGGDHDRFTVRQPGDEAVELLLRGGRVFAVEVRGVEQAAGQDRGGVPLRLLLAGRGEVATQQGTDDERVEVALVVEHEDGGPLLPKLLPTGHVEADAGEGQRPTRD